MLNFIGLLLLLGGIPYILFVVYMILGIRKADPAPVSDELPEVAVIVAARDEAHNLPHLIEDLLAQNYRGKFSIIIADDRSLDDTWGIIHRASKSHPQITAFRIVEESTEMTGKKNALTQCIKHTTAALLLETDADCRVGPGWITSMVQQFDDETGIVVGFSSVRDGNLLAKYQALDFMGIMMTNAGMIEHGKAWSGSGQNLAFRRKHFTDIGGFTGDPDQSIGDDFYLVQKIGKLSGVKTRFAWDPPSFATTAAAETIRDFYKQRKRWASDSRGLYRKDPLFFSFLASAFLLNLAILLHVLTLHFTPVLILMLMVKFGLEQSVLMLGLRMNHRLQDLWLFPVYFFLQPFYIPVMGISGLVGKVSWK